MALRIQQQFSRDEHDAISSRRTVLRVLTSSSSRPEADQLKFAKHYAHRLGWCIIPIRRKSKKATNKWSDYQKQGPTDQELDRWFGGSNDGNMAVVLGPVSGIYVRDFDTEEGYESWRAYDPDLASMCPTVRTPRGYHVYFRCRKVLRTRSYDDGELRGDGSYVLLPPSIHPDGQPYLWVHRPTFPSLIPELSDFDLNSPGFATESLSKSSSTDPPVASRRTSTDSLSVARDRQSSRLSKDRVESMSHSQGVRHIVDSLLTESRPADRGAIDWWEEIIKKEEFWQFADSELDELEGELSVGTVAFNPVFAETPSQILNRRFLQRLRRVGEELDVEAFDRESLRLIRIQSTTGLTRLREAIARRPRAVTSKPASAASASNDSAVSAVLSSNKAQPGLETLGASLIQAASTSADSIELTSDERWAIDRSLPTAKSQREKKLFELARRLLALGTLNSPDMSSRVEVIFEIWWQSAFKTVATKDRKISLDGFLRACKNVRKPLHDGMSDVMAKSNRAIQEPAPAWAENLPAACIALGRLCRELQRKAGAEPFFLSLRKAGELLRVHHSQPGRWMQTLAERNVIRIQTAGSIRTREATRYRYIAEDL